MAELTLSDQLRFAVAVCKMPGAEVHAILCGPGIGLDRSVRLWLRGQGTFRLERVARLCRHFGLALADRDGQVFAGTDLVEQARTAVTQLAAGHAGSFVTLAKAEGISTSSLWGFGTKGASLMLSTLDVLASRHGWRLVSTLAPLKPGQRRERPAERPLREARNGDPWSPGEDALLGTLPDSELARKLRRTRKSVTNRRQRLGIDAYRRSPDA